MAKIKIQIKHSWNASVLFELEKENNTVKQTVEEAIKSKANLSYANLSKANLSYANLSYANLSKANLSKANLSYANLSYANLSYANLSYANLSKANLSKADLSEADLSKADLSEAKADLFMTLLHAIPEVEGLKQALIDGRVDGSQYEGTCACLVGTIANIRHCKYDAIPDLKPDSSRPSERWFLAINVGDTPEINQVSKITVQWIEEFQMLIGKHQLTEQTI